MFVHTFRFVFVYVDIYIISCGFVLVHYDIFFVDIYVMCLCGFPSVCLYLKLGNFVFVYVDTYLYGDVYVYVDIDHICLC